MKLLKVTLGTKSKKVYSINICWVKNQLNCSLNQILNIQVNFDVKLVLFRKKIRQLHDATIFFVTIILTRA